MGVIKLQVRNPKSILGISVEPQPDWTFDALISELNALEQKLNGPLPDPPALLKTNTQGFSSLNENVKERGAFVMRAPDDDIEEFERNEYWWAEFDDWHTIFFDSEGSEDEFDHEKTGNLLMDKPGKVEGTLFEVERENRLRLQEEIWNARSSLEANVRSETERSNSNLAKVEEEREAMREKYRRSHMQYQRGMAEALDSHLSVVKRDHEQISQIEEHRIRADAAFEDAKRKEKALQEEKARQEKAKADAAAARLMAARAAEEARKAALDSERKTREAREREDKLNMDPKRNTNTKEVKEGGQPRKTGSNESTIVQSTGIIFKAAESALSAERARIQKHKEVTEMNHKLKLNSHKDFSGCERQVARLMKQVSGTEENFRAKTSGLLKIINDPLVPQSICIALFAKQVVSLCENPSVSITATAFACGRIIVCVSSQVPVTMDLVLAEFHKACIYTVPKHIQYSESAFKTREAYLKAIGFQEKDGKIESTAQYLERMESYMTLYAALIQTEIEVEGIKNTHGLQEGWAWLARLLNTLPADLSTAVALLAFLRMAGFMMFKKYKLLFKNVLNVITHQFLVSLKKIQDVRLNQIIAEIEYYIGTNQFLQEPQGRCLQTSLLSKT
ncbi:protein GLE1 [Cinnamomum micranthum f. kanehirae]|uniref:mRNA export factor GLE1 n=1 Tax=Cinnamomum micranthum f. kanehirae TaxID=337451 RepID=A0A3S3M8V0_9MAGN|nr:protein GLE1 [Cinnamomum micranthum f. kanehirae]